MIVFEHFMEMFMLMTLSEIIQSERETSHAGAASASSY